MLQWRGHQRSSESSHVFTGVPFRSFPEVQPPVAAGRKKTGMRELLCRNLAAVNTDDGVCGIR
jgi:hypothetical protein